MAKIRPLMQQGKTVGQCLLMTQLKTNTVYRAARQHLCQLPAALIVRQQRSGRMSRRCIRTVTDTLQQDGMQNIMQRFQLWIGRFGTAAITEGRTGSAQSTELQLPVLVRATT